MQFEYAPGATPIDADEAQGLIPKHIKTQAELNAWEELNIVEGADWIGRQKRPVQAIYPCIPPRP